MGSPWASRKGTWVTGVTSRSSPWAKADHVGCEGGCGFQGIEGTRKCDPNGQAKPPHGDPRGVFVGKWSGICQRREPIVLLMVRGNDAIATTFELIGCYECCCSMHKKEKEEAMGLADFNHRHVDVENDRPMLRFTICQ